jgi:hypothetical protein
MSPVPRLHILNHHFLPHSSDLRLLPMHLVLQQYVLPTELDHILILHLHLGVLGLHNSILFLHAFANLFV